MNNKLFILLFSLIGFVSIVVCIMEDEFAMKACTLSAFTSVLHIHM